MSDDTLTGGGDSGGAVASDSSAPSSAPASPPTLDSIFESAEQSLTGAAEASPSEPAAPAPTAAPTTAAQPELEQAQTAPVSPGEPPREKWDHILENARTKTREETLQHVATQYGDSLRVVEALRSDPVGTVTQLITELQADPRFAQQMASHAARTLRASRQQAAETEEPGPDLDAGNGVLLYSAGQQAKREAWLRSNWQREMQQALTPFQRDLQQRQQREQAEQRQQATMQQAQSRLGQWSQMPHFSEHKDAIRTKQAEYYAQGLDSWDALARAYGDVLATAVIPKAQQQTEQSLVGQAAKQLRAATANPSATAPAAPRKARDLDDAFELAIQQVGYGRSA